MNDIFVFWQNLLSIHQSAFLSSLSQSHHVILIVEEALDQRRQNDGWEIPVFGKCEIIINPNISKINAIFEIENAIHIFSGINAYPLTKNAFKLAIKRNVKIGIISEPFNWLRFNGKLRFIKYFFYKIRYDRYISFILTIGNRGRWCFEKTGFTKTKIFDWGYFTENIEMDISPNVDYKKKTILFVGSIDKRKNILHLVESCIKNENYISKFIIVGKGTLVGRLVEKIKDYSFINYASGVSHTEIYKYIIASDLLILPSIFDGWGAIVNESLMCGTPVLVSDHCGSAVLVKDIRGKVFSIKKKI
jgi:glycosyltransferase involved in cell wall biosynthesis